MSETYEQLNEFVEVILSFLDKKKFENLKKIKNTSYQEKLNDFLKIYTNSKDLFNEIRQLAREVQNNLNHEEDIDVVLRSLRALVVGDKVLDRFMVVLDNLTELFPYDDLCNLYEELGNNKDWAEPLLLPTQTFTRLPLTLSAAAKAAKEDYPNHVECQIFFNLHGTSLGYTVGEYNKNRKPSVFSNQNDDHNGNINIIERPRTPSKTLGQKILDSKLTPTLLIGGMVIAGYTLAVVLTHGAALVALPFVGKLLGGLLGGGAVAQAGVGAAAAAGVYGASTLPGLSVYSFLKKLFPGKNQHKSHDSSYKSHPKERFSESYGVIQDHLPNAPEGKKRPDPVDNKNQYHYGSPVNTARRKNPESTVQDTGLSTNQRAFQ